MQYNIDNEGGQKARHINVEGEKTMFKCENCPYYYKGEDDDFAYCHFEGDYLAPCEEDYYEDKDCDDWDKYDEEDY